MAARLGVTSTTVEFHRAGIMRKVGATTIPELIRLVLQSEWDHRVSRTGAESRRL